MGQRTETMAVDAVPQLPVTPAHSVVMEESGYSPHTTAGRKQEGQQQR